MLLGAILIGGILSASLIKLCRKLNESNLKAQFSQKAQKAVVKSVITVLDSKPVQKEWLGWLERAF